MSSSTSRNSYQDCFALYDRALDAPHGIRFHVKDKSAAFKLRERLHMARVIDRDQNKRLYEPGAPLHGQSVYDPLQVLIREDDDHCWWVYIEPNNTAIIGDIEELQPYEETPWLEANAPPRPISHTGIKLLEKKSGSESNVLIESSSSTPSTQPERELTTPSLRRL